MINKPGGRPRALDDATFLALWRRGQSLADMEKLLGKVSYATLLRMKKRLEASGELARVQAEHDRARLKKDFSSLTRAAAARSIAKLNMQSVFLEGQNKIEARCPNCESTITLELRVRPRDGVLHPDA